MLVIQVTKPLLKWGKLSKSYKSKSNWNRESGKDKTNEREEPV
jgi:hypothetical protein